MPTNARILWLSALSLYRELGLMVRVNVVWFVLSLPIHALLFVLSLGLMASITGPEEVPVLVPILSTAFLGLALPSPTTAGAHHVARAVLGEEQASMRLYWEGLRLHALPATLMFGIGLAGLGIGLANILFYLGMGGGLQLVAVLWAYASVFWLAMQPRLLPGLLLHPAEGLVPRYRRAAATTLAAPLASFMLLLCVSIFALASVFMPPLYALISIAYLGLVAVQLGAGPSALKHRASDHSRP